MPIKANALTFKVEKSVDTIKPNGEVTVYIKASDIGEDSIQKYNISLNYDNTKLEHRSSSSDYANINVNSNPIVITESTGTLTDGVTVATIVFGVKSGSKSGDANLTLSSSNCFAISDATKEVKATNTSSMVKVEAFSTDSSLSSLKIPNATLSPKFSKDTLDYTCSITDITEITVNAVATDSNAKIMISDNYKALQKGDNNIKISVTAEDGKSTTTYNVKVTLKLTPTQEELTKADATLSSLTIEGYDIEFDSATKKYTLTVPYSTKKITILAVSTNPNASIKLEGDANNLKVGRNTIKINVISEDEANKNSYTLTVTRNEQEKKVQKTCPDETSTKEWIIFSISMVITFTLGIILGYFLCKKEVLKKIFNRKKLDKKEIEKLSDTIEIAPITDSDRLKTKKDGKK